MSSFSDVEEDGPRQPDADESESEASEDVKGSLRPRQRISSVETTGHNGVMTSHVSADDAEGHIPTTPRATFRIQDMSSTMEAPFSSGTVTPDDLPSPQGSLLSLSRDSGISPPLSIRKRTASPSLQPFERRYQAPRASSSQSTLPRALSPAFLAAHSRSSSRSSQLTGQLVNSDQEKEPDQKLWEVMKWTRLRKLSHQAFSESGRRAFGSPTCIAVATSIVIGTSRGIILVFDYQQALKNIIGQGTAAAECGSVLSLAISADQSTIASGHATGAIFTWDMARPAKPFLHIPPMDRSLLVARTTEGHVADNPVLHIDFLGLRRTALVSADSTGMAFSHLASRGLGVVSRGVKSTRLLGRYPVAQGDVNDSRKPSAVLAFASLPLSSIEQATDDMGLTAILTPHLLVVVSTTPIAQTQHKASRPKEVTSQQMLTGALAWFPAVKSKEPLNATDAKFSRAVLAYSWSQSLELVEMQVDVVNPKENPKPPDLSFHARGRWRSEEAILTLQWLNRSVLAVLTVSQRLIILDKQLQLADSLDLIPRHVFHQNLFSGQLQALADLREETDASLRVVPDAYYMSFKTYKGRLFVLGISEVAMGTLSNWADRLASLVQSNDYIGAIKLATIYYSGDTQISIVGLSENAEKRHPMVRERLLDIMSASLEYTFADREEDADVNPREKVGELVEACFEACMNMDDLNYLFDNVYERYSDASVPDVFLYVLERYIIESRIQAIPTALLKDMTTWFVAHGFESRLEDVICALRTDSMDLDQVTTLCKENDLFDALLYVWNQALGDHITPFMELLARINEAIGVQAGAFVLSNGVNTLIGKAFSYMAMTFTGRTYPHGAPMNTNIANSARADLYNFVFSSSTVAWPGSRQSTFHIHSSIAQPGYPYLRFLLHVSTSEFMSMLNEAFEDAYLNGGSDQTTTTNSNNRTLLFNRQRIINILLDVVTEAEFASDDMVYLHIFIARNIPKFPQFVLIPGSVIKSTMEGLCNYPDEDFADECQLSVEYLMSTYRSADLQDMVPSFERAGFYRVLKTVFRSNRQWVRWLQTCFDDPDNPESVFDCIRDCLRQSTGLNQKQLRSFKASMIERAPTLAALDVARTAHLVESAAPDLLQGFLDKLEGDSKAQYSFLHTLFDAVPARTDGRENKHLDNIRMRYITQYIELMCIHDPGRVAGYIDQLPSGNLKLDQILPVMESTGVVDAAIVLLRRDGLVRDAMDRLLQHLSTLGAGLSSLLDSTSTSTSDLTTRETAVMDLLEGLQKYGKLGIWLCQGGAGQQTTPAALNPRTRPLSDEITESDMPDAEILWLDLVDKIVAISRHISSTTNPPHPQPGPGAPDPTDFKVIEALHALVQQTFTALLAATSATHARTLATRPTSPPPQPTPPPTTPPLSFPRILRAFLARAATSSPSLADLRHVLRDIFAAYAFEESVLALAGQMLDKDVFVGVAAADRRRRRGWKAASQACEGCGRRVWGAGAGGEVFAAWERGREEGERRRRERWGGGGEGGGKGKGRVGGVVEKGGEEGERREVDDLVLFACRHLWHRECLRDEWRKRAEGTKAGEEAAGQEAGREGEEGGEVVGGTRRASAAEQEVAGFQCPHVTCT